MAALLTLAEARSALNIETTDAARDAEIQDFVEAVTPLVEDVIGPTIAVTKRRTTRPYGPRLALGKRIASVSSVKEQGGTGWTTVAVVADRTSTSTQGYVLEDPENGVLLRVNSLGAETLWQGEVVVDYSAGFGTLSAVPRGVVRAAGVILRHLWEVEKQGGRPAFGTSGAELAYTPAGFGVPRRALDLLKPWERLPVIG